MAIQCPNCGSVNVKNKLNKLKGAGVGATLGAVAFGPLGLAAGAFLGSKVTGSTTKKHPIDTKGRPYGLYGCKYCKEEFLTCPQCKNGIQGNNCLCEYCNNTIIFPKK